MSAAGRETAEAKYAEAVRAYRNTPNDPDSIIWLGRRTAYLGRFREAIDIYSKGIARHPTDARLYRHRGHRYLTVRKIDRAIADFSKAAELTSGKPDEVEPDGLPNARNIPVGTLQSNIRYHLGLGHYLKGHFDEAAKWFRRDVDAAVNPDMVVASSHWLYMALRRLGRTGEAEAVLAPISRDMPIIENGSYHRLLLFYKGELTAEQLAGSGAGDLEDVTVSYGLGNWNLYSGRISEARRILARILASDQWPAFGYLAAEAEVARAGR
ncbi:MAG: tetratricopeptide repeat protein [Gemmatimonadota bacterium]